MITVVLQTTAFYNVSIEAVKPADVLGRTEIKGDTKDDVSRGAGERVSDKKGSMMGAYDDDGVGEVGACAAAKAGAGERPGLGDGIKEIHVDQEFA